MIKQITLYEAQGDGEVFYVVESPCVKTPKIPIKKQSSIEDNMSNIDKAVKDCIKDMKETGLSYNGLSNERPLDNGYRYYRIEDSIFNKVKEMNPAESAERTIPRVVHFKEHNCAVHVGKAQYDFIPLDARVLVGAK